MKNQVKATDKDLVLTLLLGWAGYWRLKKGQKGLAVLWFFTLGCAGIGWLVDIFACLAAIQKTQKSTPQFVSPQQAVPTYTPVQAVPQPYQTLASSPASYESSNTLKKPHFLDFLEGQEKTYAYENVELYIVPGQEPDFSKIGLHEFVDFVQEPDNTYDNKAVYAVLDGQKLGYFKKNRLQDMMNDYIRRSDCDVIGYVSQVDFASRKITLDIAFYRDVEILSKVKLTACKGQDAQDALLYANEDDIVTIEYDYLKEAYIVSDDAGNIIGRLPKSLNSKLDDYDDVKGYICSIDFDDNGKCVPTVAIY